MSNAKKTPSRRDYREAVGYLEDYLLDSPCVGDGRAADLAKELIDHAQEVRVQRSMDRLALFFDLDESGPETTDSPEVMGGAGIPDGEFPGAEGSSK